MVFGNMGNDSATGVLFTATPRRAAPGLYGDYLTNAQGEDVVAGIRTPKSIAGHARGDAGGRMKSSTRYRPVTREALSGSLRTSSSRSSVEALPLQTRAAKMGPMGAVRAAVDMVNEGLISKEEAVLRITPEQLELLVPSAGSTQQQHMALAPWRPAAPVRHRVGSSSTQTRRSSGRRGERR